MPRFIDNNRDRQQNGGQKNEKNTWRRADEIGLAAAKLPLKLEAAANAFDQQVVAKFGDQVSDPKHRQLEDHQRRYCREMQPQSSFEFIHCVSNR